MRARTILVGVALASCGTPDARDPSFLPDSRPSGGAQGTPSDATRSTPTARGGVTQSPWPVATGMDPRARDFASACGVADGALTHVAQAIAESRAHGGATPDADDVASLLRVVGEPHMRPQILVASAPTPLADEPMRRRLAGLDAQPGASRRCGVATIRTADGGEILVAIAIDALADLGPLPMQARTGEWLVFDARVHHAARDARLVVLGPRGAPRTVPTSLDRATGRTRARFALDRPGVFTVQLVVELETGPRPLLEARIFADVAPTDEVSAVTAPGEDAGRGSEGAAALDEMVTALRRAEDLPLLARDRELDALAAAHAESMRRTGATAHDLGEGDLRARFDDAGLSGRALGENVAHASSVRRAHRALYGSASHRMNLLRADYTHMGLAVARAADGSVYVCEVFAALAKR